jgi:hypothetical protein
MLVRWTVKSNDALCWILKIISYINDPDIALIGTEERPDGAVDIVIEDRNDARTQRIKDHVGG